MSYEGAFWKYIVGTIIWPCGKAYVTISHVGLFTIDINGQMDDQDTGKLPKEKGK